MAPDLTLGIHPASVRLCGSNHLAKKGIKSYNTLMEQTTTTHKTHPKQKICKQTERPLKTTIKTRRWSAAQRLAQAQRIRIIQPWLHSTGPKTIAGKTKTSQNTLKHGGRNTVMRQISQLLKQQRIFLKNLKITASWRARKTHLHFIYNYLRHCTQHPHGLSATSRKDILP
jgi:hypothetical protein